MLLSGSGCVPPGGLQVKRHVTVELDALLITIVRSVSPVGFGVACAFGVTGMVFPEVGPEGFGGLVGTSDGQYQDGDGEGR